MYMFRYSSTPVVEVACATVSSGSSPSRSRCVVMATPRQCAPRLRCLVSTRQSACEFAAKLARCTSCDATLARQGSTPITQRCWWCGKVCYIQLVSWFVICLNHPAFAQHCSCCLLWLHLLAYSNITFHSSAFISANIDVQFVGERSLRINRYISGECVSFLK